MRAKTRLARQRADETAAARADARALTFELAGFAPVTTFDAMQAGLVLGRGETAYRFVAAWLRQRTPHGWSEASWCQVLVTDRRLLLRLGDGVLISLWWGSLVGFQADLVHEHVTLDYGDGSPRLLSGTAAPILAVAGVSQIYGPEALLTHPALEPLRTNQETVTATD